MKYIIEFEDVPSFAEDGIAYYQCKQAPWWYSGDMLIGKLTSAQEILSEIDKIDQKVDEAYQRGVNDGSLDVKQRVEGAYQKGKLDGRLDGQNETWECAKKIALMDTETSENVTGYFGLFRIMENLTPMQAIEKLKAYEEKQKAEDEIKVRDEVMVYGHCGVVTYVHDNLYTVMMHDGSCGNWGRNELKKTGKKHDIDKILEAMKE